MFKLRQDRVPIFGTFSGPLSRRILFETAQILEPFWFLFLGRELYQITTFCRWPDYLPAQVWPEKSILWLSADETNLSRVGLGRRWAIKLDNNLGVATYVRDNNITFTELAYGG